MEVGGSSGTIVCLKLMVRSFHIRSGYFWRIKIKQLNNLKKKNKKKKPAVWRAGYIYLRRLPQDLLTGFRNTAPAPALPVSPKPTN